MEARWNYSYTARDIYYSYRKITKYSKKDRLTDKQFIALLTTFIKKYIWQQLDKGLSAVFPYNLFKVHITKKDYPKNIPNRPTYLDITDNKYYKVQVSLPKRTYPYLELMKISSISYKKTLESKIREWFSKNKYYPAKFSR